MVNNFSLALEDLKKPEPPLPVELSADFSKMNADEARYEKEYADYKKALVAYKKALLERGK